MAKTGYIAAIKYTLGADITAPIWYDLGTTPPELDLNTIIALAIGWYNSGDEEFQGHVALDITKPDASVQTLIPVSGQDAEVDEGEAGEVVFGSVTLDQVGAYAGVATLTEAGETDVLDTNIFLFADVPEAEVPTPPGIGLNIESLITAMIVVAMMGMAMKAMQS